MNADIGTINTIANILYPFISLYAWYRVHKHNKARERDLDVKLQANQSKVNGRLDELIQAEKKLSYEQGRKEVIAEMLMGKVKGVEEGK